MVTLLRATLLRDALLSVAITCCVLRLLGCILSSNP
jgi:hypothetical protein